MKNKRIMKPAIAFAMMVFVFFGVTLGSKQVAFAGTNLTDLDQYPGIKTFDFTSDPVRETISESVKVDPKYVIKISKTMPDEYFGAAVTEITDTRTGEIVRGFKLGYDGVRGECGCIYRNMFQYRGKWIDVKTTYTNWNYQSKKAAFISGGFARYRWQCINWIEMKNEFFIAGTNTSIEVKGFLIYNDVDNKQGLYFDPNEVGDIWTNSGGTYLGYKIIPANEEYVQNITCSYQLDREMISIQSKTATDISAEGEENYDAGEAAKTNFALTISASIFHTCLIDDDSQGFNLLSLSAKKTVPSAFPDENSTEVTKTVSDDDEKSVTSNSVRSWEKWTYSVNVVVPPETEQGNFYDAFSICDSVDPELSIKSMKVTRGDGEDVSDIFTISQEDNLITAMANSLDDADFYANEYHLVVEVEAIKPKAEMIKENKLNENFEIALENVATVTYEDGNGAIEVDTNETSTIVKYETDADVIITKKVNADDIYTEHGKASFLFKLEGQTITGQNRTLNGQVTISEEYANAHSDDNENVEKTFTFHNVPEGEYVCSEYETIRFASSEIIDVIGGNVSDKMVKFTIDDKTECTATFVNQKKNWGNYSESNIVINRVGIGVN